MKDITEGKKKIVHEWRSDDPFTTKDKSSEKYLHQKTQENSNLLVTVVRLG